MELSPIDIINEICSNLNDYEKVCLLSSSKRTYYLKKLIKFENAKKIVTMSRTNDNCIFYESVLSGNITCVLILKMIRPYELPITIKYIRFGDLFDNTIRRNQIREGVKEIYFGY